MTSKDLQLVCRLDDIPDGGGREAVLRRSDGELPVMLLREGARVYAYINICPHQGRMLNYGPDKFMVRDGTVMCCHHGATFRVSDGACVGGPCRGAALRRVRAIVQDGAVHIGESENDG